jgi:hypothetical protein
VGYRAGAPGSETAQLGRCAVGGRRWQVGGRRGERLADDDQVVQQGVEGLVVQGAHDGGDELLDLGQHPVQTACPAGVRSTRTRRRSAGLRRGISWQTHPTARLRSRSPCVVAWTLNANDAN